jgi:hypothetical protein
LSRKLKKNSSAVFDDSVKSNETSTDFRGTFGVASISISDCHRKDGLDYKLFLITEKWLIPGFGKTHLYCGISKVCAMNSGNKRGERGRAGFSLEEKVIRMYHEGNSRELSPKEV